MKLAFINASPKPKNTVSGNLLHILAQFLQPQQPLPVFRLQTVHPCPAVLNRLADYSTLVLAFPVYLDALPAHLICILEQLAPILRPGTRVYTLANCGFYEGEQTIGCHRIVKNWCSKNSFCYAGGVGVGGSGSIWLLKKLPAFLGLRRSLDRALSALALAILQQRLLPVVYATVNYPRFCYLLGAELSWNQKGRKHGLSPQELKLPHFPH